jgi:glycosidase
MIKRFAFVLLTVLLALQLSTLAGAAITQRDFSKEQARQSREWVKDAVIYEIFTRNFSREGNFKGVMAKLDDLKNLGVNVLWLMPIHPTGIEQKKGSIGSPYAVRDYYAINADYGTKEDFKRLVEETHQRGMKIIIDIVANHTSWDSVLMQDKAFYKRDASGKILSPYDWTDVAALNYDNAKVRQYMTEMLKYWMSEFKLDGFRCDVAWLVPTDFWENARTELEKINPEIILIAEASAPDLLLKAFDMDYAWPGLHAIEDVITGRRPAWFLRDNWLEERARYPKDALRMRFSDNHDERRAVVEFGRPAALAASAFVLTMDGVPLLYNGMEVGDTTESGAPALFERLPIFWQIAERRPEIPHFYKEMLALRRTHPALRQGATEWLKNSDETRVVTYLRRSKDEEIFVAMNFSNRPFTGLVEVANNAMFTEITPEIAAADTNKMRTPGLPAVSLEAWGYRLFRRAIK